MNYYVAIIQINNAGASSQVIYNYPDLDAALAAFYQEMSYGINAKLNGVTCVLVDQQGAIYKTESWTNPDAIKPVVETTEE